MAYLELAYEIGTVNHASTNSITSFDQLTTEIQRAFPDKKVILGGSNPFPGLLPKHNNEWLSSWKSIANQTNIPLIWTTVQLREPAVLYIATDGEIHVEKTNKFSQLINENLLKGAQLGSVAK
jgi:hypothetical protein